MPQPITTHVFTDYWEADGRPSRLAELIRGQQARPDPAGLAALAERLSAWFAGLNLPRGAVVVAVPANPDRIESDFDGANFVARLGAALAEAAGLAFEASWLTRSSGGPRLRDLRVQHRQQAVRRAGYGADPAVHGRHLVLVDDVVLTGTTTQHLAAVALQAGAASVTVAVAARTRRAGANMPR